VQEANDNKKIAQAIDLFIDIEFFTIL